MKRKYSVGCFLLPIVLLVSSPALMSAVDEIDLKVPPEDENVQKVMATLDETLKENRDLRGEVEKNIQEVENVKAQNTLLANQIRELQAQIEALKKESGAKDAELRKREEDLKNQLDLLEKERQASDRVKVEAGEQVKAFEEENARLQTFLDESVLKGEKKNLRKVVKEASKTNKRAVKALSKSESARMDMKNELAEQYYTIGNMYFDKQQYRKAASNYRKALKMNPNDSWAHHNVAVIYDYYFHKSKKAIYHYKKYLRLKPLEEEAWDVRERVLELDTLRYMVPARPVKEDFNKYHRDLKIKTESGL